MPTCHEKRATLSQNCENAFFGKRRSHAHDSRESDHSNVKSAPKTDRPDRYDILLECRSYYLAQLAALLRDCQLVSEAAIAAILQGTGKHFDDMQVSRRLGSFSEEARGLTSSRISLVGDDDLELNIRLDGLCNRLAESTSVPLWKTHLRFITLLDRPDLPKTHNPVGPQGIIQGLQTLFKAAGATTLDDKLDLLDRIEIVLGEGLPAIYTQIDGLLDRAGAATAQASIVSAQEAPRPATAKPAASLPTTTGNAAPGSAGNESLLARLAATAGGGTGIATGAQLLSQVALDNLMFRLEQLERTQRNDSDFLTASSPNLEALIPELFADSPKPAAAAARPVRARELGIPGNTSEGQAIDAVGAFCDAIFADPELPEALKLLIASLQVSLVKLAIKDRSLFTRNDHPARGTIDRLGRAFMARPPPSIRSSSVWRPLSSACVAISTAAARPSSPPAKNWIDCSRNATHKSPPRRPPGCPCCNRSSAATKRRAISSNCLAVANSMNCRQCCRLSSARTGNACSNKPGSPMAATAPPGRPGLKRWAGCCGPSSRKPTANNGWRWPVSCPAFSRP